MRPDTRFGARALLIAGAIALIAVPFSLLLFLVQDQWRPLLRVDDGVRDDLHALVVHDPTLVSVLKAFSFVGSVPVMVAVFTALVAWLAWQRLPRLAVFVAVTMIGGSLLNELVKLLVDRARPVFPDAVAHATGRSFPSGHAQGAVVAYTVLLLVFLPKLRGARRALAIAAAVFMVLAIGFSRIALGVHYVSDVLAGYVLGAAWVAGMVAAFNLWRRERGHPPVAPSEGLEPALGGAIPPREPEARPPRQPASPRSSTSARS
jgi:membrane-associated phospholipid phosphatase